MIGKDRVAVITGAAGNLGQVVARSLADNGVRLALFGTNAERLQRMASNLNLPEDHLLTGAFDLTQAESAQAAAGLVLDTFGRADILAHLVGGWTGGKPVTDVPPADLSHMLNQHLWTTFHLAQAFVPHFVTNRWGRIIVVSSPVASNPPANMAPYAVGKAAEEALVLTIARETAGTGVTANILQVRAIDAQHERDRQPSARNASWTTPEEVTAAILYLCSDEAQVVSGARIPLYGSK